MAEFQGFTGIATVVQKSSATCATFSADSTLAAAAWTTGAVAVRPALVLLLNPMLTGLLMQVIEVGTVLGMSTAQRADSTHFARVAAETGKVLPTLRIDCIRTRAAFQLHM